MDLKSHEERSSELVRILQALPPTHKETLERIVFHLARVAEKQEENKMDPQNLAIIMAPCIIRAPDHVSALEVAQQIGQTTRAIEIIIKNQLEMMRSKFRSISELEAAEHKITRRLTNARQSRRIRGQRHRQSAVIGSYDKVDSEHKVLPFNLEHKLNKITFLNGFNK